MKTDLIHALRSLARTPVLAAVIVLSLGVGIGVNTVVFSWIQALMFRPLPGVSDASLFHLVETRNDVGLRPGSSWLEYRDLQEQVPSLSDLMAFRMVPLNVGEASRTERATALLVSGNYFVTLRMQPALGRLLRIEEASTPGRDPVVVVSYDYWRTHLGARAGVIGERLRVNDVDLAIVGVTPAGFQGTVLGLQFDLWVPATMAPALLGGSRELSDRSLRGYYVMGRLESDALEQAQAEAAAAMRRLARDYPESNATMTADVLPFWRASRGPQGLLLQGLWILQGVMLLLLLAVCGNTANLVLARASGRVREMGVRLAIGAGAWRIVRLLLVENLVLGIAASLIGMLIALWGSNALRAMPTLTTAVPVRFQTNLNELGLAFAIASGILCALLFGAAPAVQLARLSPQSVLRAGAATAPRSGMRQVLMAAEVALALVVLIVAGLFFQSFRQTQQTNPGFRAQGVLLATYDLMGRDSDAAAARLFADRLLSRLRALPDVDAAAIATSIPLDIHGLPVRSFALEGRPRTDGALDRSLSNTVTPGYFKAMDIALVGGSDFVELGDTTMPPQAIVNEAFVQRYVDRGEPLGRRITMGETTYVISGVVRTTLNDSFSEPPTPVIYLSYRDRPSRFGEMHLRTRLGDETMLAPAVRRAVREVDGSLPTFNVRTLTQHIDMSLALRRIPARMFVVLGPLILVLAAIGIYAVVAHGVAHRTAEIGVRIALGASAGRVRRQVISESLGVVAAGALVGWVFVAYFYTQFLRGPLDVSVFAGVPVLLLGVATAACWLPAWRASQVDPMVALRTQ
jgi:predicted permease